MSKRHRSAYFKAFAIEKGPVLFGIPTRKPHPKTLKSYRAKIDEDGLWYSMFEDYKSLDVYTPEAKHLLYSTIACDINVKRAMRRQIEPTLAKLSRDLATLKEQLDRIERKLEAGDARTTSEA